MTTSLAVAAIVAFARPSPAVPRHPDVRVIRARDATHRYVRLRLDIDGDGVRGTETSLYDLATGRYTDRVDAGILSFRDGFDGTHVWSSDVTGMPTVEGNAQQRLDSLAWAHFFGRSGPEQPASVTTRASGGEIVVRIRYASLSGPIEVTLDRATGFVRAIHDSSGSESGDVRFSDYRRAHDVVVPFGSATTSRFGVWHERVRTVELPATVTGDAFAPPPRPDDVVLDGLTSIPMELRGGQPIVPIRVDDGPVLHVLFDTGASNYLTPRAARRLHLTLVGAGKGGGFGPGVVARRYTTVKRLRIGRAELHGQPFSVMDDHDEPGIDGTIGCEVMQRFAVRFDFRRRRVDLARDVRTFGRHGAPIPMRLAGCQPEIDGAVDGMRGPLGIDTGDANAVLLMAPFVRAHRLVERYHATDLTVSEATAGRTVGLLARARTVQLGPIDLHNVEMELSTMTRGASNDPTELGNVGVEILSRFVTVFDYRSNRMWLLR